MADTPDRISIAIARSARSPRVQYGAQRVADALTAVGFEVAFVNSPVGAAGKGHANGIAATQANRFPMTTADMPSPGRE